MIKKLMLRLWAYLLAEDSPTSFPKKINKEIVVRQIVDMSQFGHTMDIISTVDEYIRNELATTKEMPLALVLNRPEYDKFLKAISGRSDLAKWVNHSNLNGIYYKGCLFRPKSPFTQGFMFDALGYKKVK